jgi:hypothetical protein
MFPRQVPAELRSHILPCPARGQRQRRRDRQLDGAHVRTLAYQVVLVDILNSGSAWNRDMLWILDQVAAG